jgi:hypothetical protein
MLITSKSGWTNPIAMPAVQTEFYMASEPSCLLIPPKTWACVGIQTACVAAMGDKMVRSYCAALSANGHILHVLYR